MRVEVLGPGCPRCRQLSENVRTALARLGADVEVHKVEDLQQIMAYGVIGTPALAIGGKVVLAGRVPAPRELERYLTAHGVAAPAG